MSPYIIVWRIAQQANYRHLFTHVQIAGCGRLKTATHCVQHSYQLCGAESSFNIVLARVSRYLGRYYMFLVK
jgi:hypothetical protein